MGGIITAIATPVATVLRGIHALLSTFLAPSSGPAWGLSIVLLTICVRLVLFPLFVKQIKSQRRMQQLAPQMKELQARHKGDRETLNTELMKLYKENNTNPISGCLPLILQLPVFFALFSVIREFKPGAHAKYGLSAEDLHEGGRASIFGAPLSASFRSSTDLIHRLGGTPGVVKSVAVILIVVMGATTFWTQRQMMARAGAAADAQQQQVQKMMLYVLPVILAVTGISFPIGVLLYWLTTNVWSMGQQHYVIKRMPPPVTGGSSGGRPGPSGDRKGPNGGGGPGKPGKAKKVEPEPDGTEAITGSGVLTATGTTTQAATGGASTRPPNAKRAAGSRKNKKRGKR
ncbi:MAG: YidC/Oxa1 family rane protein insertase [Actinomycetota bacterium]|jgi:YidC/Oxa1 family membrane protein insertase|nr:YidC/Oxa1 family rane protein insertase [Actinomycetota bacterium]